MPAPGRYDLRVTRSAARTLSEELPEPVAAAVLHLLTGDLLIAPRRVGKPLRRELEGLWVARRGTYRVLYAVDDAAALVRVVHVAHRRDAYRRG